MENFPKTLLKVYLTSQTFTGLFFNCTYSSNSTAKEFYWLRNIYYFLCNWNFPWWKGKNSSFEITLMRKKLLICLQLEKISAFPQTSKRFYRCRSIPLFFYIYCVCRKAYLHDDIKSDDEYFMAECSGCGECYHKKCMNIQVKVFEMRSTTCHGNAMFAENKVYELYNLCSENKGLICGRLSLAKSSTRPIWIFFWNSLFEVFILNSTWRYFASMELLLRCVSKIRH